VIPAALWSAVAAVVTVGVEWTMKETADYWRWLWLFLPVAVVQQYLFWRVVQESQNLISAFVYFSATIAVLRIGITLSQGYPVGVGSWIAAALLLGASAACTWRP
jgi:hypothetical protein